MTSRQYFYLVLAMLILCVGFGIVGCGDDDENGGDDGGDDEMMIPAKNLDCENNWVREDGANGRLYQAVEITINVPADYNGPLPPYLVGSALTSNPEVPAMDMPELMGESDTSADLTPGEPYAYVGSFHNRASAVQDEVCGQYFHLAIQIYEQEGSFPTGGEWIHMTEAQYQVGGDVIVLDDADMINNVTD